MVENKFNRFFNLFKIKPKPLWTPELQMLIDENKCNAECLIKKLDNMRSRRYGLTINHDKVE
jgi:hypothetical protein